MLVLADILTLFCDFHTIQLRDVMAEIRGLLERFRE
jgi:hypothetical protein